MGRFRVLRPSTPPDFLVIGHLSEDRDHETPLGWRIGGTAAYAARLANRLGLSAAMLTSAAPDLPVAELFPHVDVAVIPSAVSTQFENRYRDARREQYVRGMAARITQELLPSKWRSAPIVLIGPIMNEVDVTVAALLRSSVVGVCLQGWLREVDSHGRVRPVPLNQAAEIVQSAAAAVLFLSEDDIGRQSSARMLVRQWSMDGPSSPLIVLTRGASGAEVWERGEVRSMPAFEVSEVDATGAGDVFAAAFLIRYRECRNPADSAAFAAAAAAISVGGHGIDAIPDRAAIEQLLSDQPEVRLS